MQKRSVRKIFLWQILTLGFYFIYWCRRSKNEVNSTLGNQTVPSVWWFLVPFGGYYWAWLYAEAVEKATSNKIKHNDVFGLFILATIGAFVGQFGFGPDSFPPDNTVSDHEVWRFIVIAIVIISYLWFLAVLALFPVILQSKFNKLHTERSQNSGPHSPSPIS